MSMKTTFINIIRQEERQLADEIDKEQRRPAPDSDRLSELEQEAHSLRRHLERIPEA